MLKLQVTEGNAAGSDIAVEEELVIGRTASEEGRLGDDPEISRQHARVMRAAEGYVVEDLGSMNGTFVNGDRLQSPHQLTEGDQIEVGATRLMAHLDQPDATPTPGTGIPQQDELGATRIAGVPDLPDPQATPGPQGGDTFVKPVEEAPAAGAPPEPAAGPQAPPAFPGPQAPPPPAAGPPPPPEPPPPPPPPPPPAPGAGPQAPGPPPPPAPTDLPPPTGPPQDTKLPAPVPVEQPTETEAEPEPELEARFQDTEVPQPEARSQDTEVPQPEGRLQDTEVPEPAPVAQPVAPVSLRVDIDIEAGEATIALDEGGDSVTLAREEGRWVLKPG